MTVDTLDNIYMYYIAYTIINQLFLQKLIILQKLITSKGRRQMNKYLLLLNDNKFD